MKRNHTWRYLSVAIVFCLVSIVYLGRLFYIQISGGGADYGDGTNVRTVTVQAVRGQLYDRNGKPLTTNAYTYDLTLDHQAFTSLGTVQRGEVSLSLLDTLAACGEADKHVESYFPLEGVYPYYRWSDAVEAKDTLEYYRLVRVLDDVGLAENTTAKKLVDYYVNTYELLSTDKNGKRRFTDDEIDRLIRFYYDMNACRFGSATNYTVAKEVSLASMTAIKEKALGGVTFVENVKRMYQYPGYASHILGTVGPIYAEDWEYYNEQGYQMNALVGKSGCELAFEEYLRGTDGKMQIVEDASGNIISTTLLKAPVPGNDVYLTLDIDLQIAAEDGLAENVAYVADRAQGIATLGSNCASGAAVAMDPDTFEVLAIASCPTYDLSTYNLLYNDLAADENLPLLNRALNGRYAPGSTYKPGVAVAALMASREGKLSEEERVSIDTLLSCYGTYTRYESYQPACSTVSSHRGMLDVVKAIADSCNCFFYELGYRMGIDNMNSYMSAFGFGEDTGIELGGDVGVLAGPEYRQEIHGAVWREGDTLPAAIGQSDNQATPLQLACYISTLSNGGSRYSAHLLKEVRSHTEETPVYTYTLDETSLKSRLEISEDVLDTVLLGMRNMVTSHTTARNHFASVPVRVGGKTGTAETTASKRGEGSENALFVGVAPYDDPEIVLSVVLEEGHMGEYATMTAARILEAYYGVGESAES